MKWKNSLLTEEDTSKVLDREDKSDTFSEDSDDFLFDRSEEDSDSESDTSSVVHESEPYEEASDFSPPYVPHGRASPRFAFLTSGGVNADFDVETSALECFQKFTDKDMLQLFAEQTKIYAYKFLAANPNWKPWSQARGWMDTNNENSNWTPQSSRCWTVTWEWNLFLQKGKSCDAMLLTNNDREKIPSPPKIPSLCWQIPN